jgi:AAA+ superfamily predicted ATPase
MALVKHVETLEKPDGIARLRRVPNDEFGPAWSSIALPDGTKERLLAQSLLALTVRQKLAFESAPLHGLILLMGPPGTGKTTIGRGLANQIAKQIPNTETIYIEVDPHALASSSLGHSQKAVTKLFEQTIPELALNRVAVVLLDELETLAVSRHQLSMDANPIDVHRATDAVLAGMDRLTLHHQNVLLIGTTNFPKALDSAVLSRADHIEEFPLPNQAARQEIILDTIRSAAATWRGLKALEMHAPRLAKLADGLDGRRIRKEFFTAMASDVETAKDPSKLTIAQIEAAFTRALKTQKELQT